MFLTKNAANSSFGSLIASLVLVLVTGCTSMNSVTYNSACTDQNRHCGCKGSESCNTMSECTSKCSPDNCSCDQLKHQITMNHESCGSCK